MRSFLFLVVAAVAACGGDNHAKPDSPPAMPDAPPDAPSAPPFGSVMPTVGGGSAVIASPKLVLITANNDPNQAAMETFASQYAASSAWADQVSEYGVGAFTVVKKRIATAPTTDAAAVALITQNTTGAHPAWGATDPNAIYMFILTSGDKFDDGTGSTCADYFGYHYDKMVGNVDAAYAIVCTETDSSHPEMTELQATTSTASHELVEAATDPWSNPPGYSAVDDANYAWEYITDFELADMCQYADTAYWTGASGMGSAYALQRTWSNTAAKAGHDPCVGDPATPYYQSVPEQPDAEMVKLPNGDGTFDMFTTTAKKIPVGMTGTLRVHVYADQPTAGPFTVTLDDLNANELVFTQPTGTFMPGDDIEVTVMVTKADTKLGGQAEAFEVVTAPASGPKTYYYGLIGQ
jgi:hypothetical protein